MTSFIHDNFLLQSQASQQLYHNYAKNQPIFDYHCHLNPKDIADDRRFDNITQIWLGGDHYKWRVMRANGIPEELITGKSSDYDKFKAFASSMPYCLGNPVYHWAHLELKRYFGIDTLLNANTAEEIWNKSNEIIQTQHFSVKNIIKDSNVKVLCTTDDPTDSLERHDKILSDVNFDVHVYPAFRPDKALSIQHPEFSEWIRKLELSADISILTFDNFLTALKARIIFFHSHGYRISDHALDEVFFEELSQSEISVIFNKARNGIKLTLYEISAYKTFILTYLSDLYAQYGWAMQLHIGALRNTNTNMLKKMGADSGYDSIGNPLNIKKLANLLDFMEQSQGLPKTILYCSNPSDNLSLATLAGNFHNNETPSKIQFGSAWWFNDQKNEIISQLTTLANTGLLGRFIGMTTDSRSFLSYPRHEYFRRVLCGLVGEWVDKGELPDDIELVGDMVRNICYNNAVKYFNQDR